MRMPEKIPDSKPSVTRILMGGALEAPGDPVTPGVLSALGLASSKDEGDAFAVTNETTVEDLSLLNG